MKHVNHTSHRLKKPFESQNRHLQLLMMEDLPKARQKSSRGPWYLPACMNIQGLSRGTRLHLQATTKIQDTNVWKRNSQRYQYVGVLTIMEATFTNTDHFGFLSNKVLMDTESPCLILNCEPKLKEVEIIQQVMDVTAHYQANAYRKGNITLAERHSKP